LDPGICQDELKSQSVRLGVVVVIENVTPFRLESLDRPALAYLKDDLSGTSLELAPLLSREQLREPPKSAGRA